MWPVFVFVGLWAAPRGAGATCLGCATSVDPGCGAQGGACDEDGGGFQRVGDFVVPESRGRTPLRFDFPAEVAANKRLRTPHADLAKSLIVALAPLPQATQQPRNKSAPWSLMISPIQRFPNQKGLDYLLN